MAYIKIVGVIKGTYTTAVYIQGTLNLKSIPPLL